MLCAFCMRANNSSCFLAQPYLDVPLLVAACSFGDLLDAVDGPQKDVEHTGQAVIETSL
jgi:hypothetical protein